MVDSKLLGAEAVALEPPFRYAILLNAGSFFLLLDAFTKLLADPRVFMDQGDPKLESRTPAKLASLPAHVDSALHSDPEKSHTFASPNCPTRKQYAHLLVRLAVRGIAMHELAHVVQGHLLLEPREELRPLDWRTLEYAADMYAVGRMAEHAWHEVHVSRVVPGMQNENDALLVTLRALFLSHYFAEECFAPTGKDETTRTHLLARERQELAAWGFPIAWSSVKKTKAQLPFDLSDVWLECERGVHTIRTGHTDLEYIKRFFLTSDERTLHMQNWQEILRPRLETLSFAGLFTVGPTDDSKYGDIALPRRRRH